MSGAVMAVCGKGGVGKTSVCAVIASEILRRGRGRALVVDADPAGGLGLSLDLAPKRSVNQVRMELIREAASGESDRFDLAGGFDYLLAEALAERGNLAFLSVGRPQELGCYCSVNSLLREAIEKLAAQFDTVLIDGEAGVEQINREVMREAAYLLLVADPTVKALRVAESIDTVFRDTNSKSRTGLLLNRVADEKQAAELEDRTRLWVVGWIPEDDTIRRYDAQNLSFFDLPGCPASRAIIDAVNKTGLLL
jgi:CO dehydrogenase maturation factor